ncbi:MAG: Holliday junction branch migration protein RuvA [Pyrinomonadaceae bacterium]|nr:Holliday junction branch migration protein RuvA [Pyrinomonadaceae bacterium]
MIAYLSGKLIEKEANSIIVDVGGIGYEAIISLSTFYELGEINSPVSLRIYTYVREDTLQLFGFITAKERSLFLKLITVSGIGPKLAITMLSGMGADEIIVAIRSDNLVALTSIPGIGKKTAERLVIELRDKIAEIGGGDTSAKPNVNINGDSASSEIYDDTLSALMNLGYQQKPAAKALNKAIKDDTEMSVQKLLRRSLQLLAKG